MNFLTFALAGVLATCVSSQRADFLNSCPNFQSELMPQFDMADFQGLFFVQRETPLLQEITNIPTCKVFIYHGNPTVDNDRFTYHEAIGSEDVFNTYTGSYQVRDASKSMVSVSFPDDELDDGVTIIGSDSFKNVNQFIVAGDTDPTDGWMIIKSCTNVDSLFFSSFDYAWVLTRKKTPTAATLSAVSAAVSSKLSGYTLTSLSQAGCVENNLAARFGVTVAV